MPYAAARAAVRSGERPTTPTSSVSGRPAKMRACCSPHPGADDGDAQPGFHQATLVAPDLASAYGRPSSGEHRRAGARLGRRDDPGDHAADPRLDHLHPRRRQPVPLRPRLRARRQPGVRPGRGGASPRSSAVAQALLFASGMAAATAVFQALAPGDHVLAPKVMYWSLRNWLMDFATSMGPRRRADRHDRAGRGAGGDPARARRSWCGSRRRPTRCGRSPTSPPPRSSRMPPARCWRSTRPWPRRC